MKIEVEQVDDNDSWLYDENQVICWIIIVVKLYLRHPVLKSVVSHSFGCTDVLSFWKRVFIIVVIIYDSWKQKS